MGVTNYTAEQSTTLVDEYLNARTVTNQQKADIAKLRNEFGDPATIKIIGTWSQNAGGKFTSLFGQSAQSAGSPNVRQMLEDINNRTKNAPADPTREKLQTGIAAAIKKDPTLVDKLEQQLATNSGLGKRIADLAVTNPGALNARLQSLVDHPEAAMTIVKSAETPPEEKMKVPPKAPETKPAAAPGPVTAAASGNAQTQKTPAAAAPATPPPAPTTTAAGPKPTTPAAATAPAATPPASPPSPAPTTTAAGPNPTTPAASLPPAASAVTPSAADQFQAFMDRPEVKKFAADNPEFVKNLLMPDLKPGEQPTDEQLAKAQERGLAAAEVINEQLQKDPKFLDNVTKLRKDPQLAKIMDDALENAKNGDPKAFKESLREGLGKIKDFSALNGNFQAFAGIIDAIGNVFGIKGLGQTIMSALKPAIAEMAKMSEETRDTVKGFFGGKQQQGQQGQPNLPRRGEELNGASNNNFGNFLNNPDIKKATIVTADGSIIQKIPPSPGTQPNTPAPTSAAPERPGP